MPQAREEILTTSRELADCCEYLASQPILGFDTEFVGEETYHPRLCLVQVAAPGRLFLIDPFATGPLDEFWKLLHDPARVVIVHAGREEVRLCRLWSGQPPANLFDLQLAAGLLGLTYPMGHGGLVNELLGVRLSKGETLTEWRRRPLTTEQLRYAFDDVRYLLALYEKLTTRLGKLGRLEWAQEEFARLARAVSRDEPVTEERWRKLKGVGSLDRRKLAVVRALYEWREQRAAELNRPARTVVRDDLVVEIARRNPARPRDLQVVRGLAHRDLDAIVDVVQDVRKLSMEDCPRPADRIEDLPQLSLVAGVLIAVLGDLCARSRLATNLAASNNDIRILVRARLAGDPVPGDLLLAQGWRARHLLPDLLAVLEGRRLVRVANLKAEAPFGYEDEPPPLSGEAGNS